MKTPREILLTRHRAAEPRLDAVRQAAVAAVCDRRHSPATTPGWPARILHACLGCPNTLWRELILPSRRLWTGLAAVWFLIFLVNVSQRDPVSSVSGRPVRSAPVTMTWQTRQRLIAELLSDRVTPPDADRPRNVAPKPRTENCGVARV